MPPGSLNTGGILMKKRLICATLLTVLAALLVSSVVGIWVLREREMSAARQTLHELLIIMDAQSAITDPESLTEQFNQAAPEKRLTIIDADGTVEMCIRDSAPPHPAE